MMALVTFTPNKEVNLSFYLTSGRPGRLVGLLAQISSQPFTGAHRQKRTRMSPNDRSLSPPPP